jgi:hypothetical protein
MSEKEKEGFEVYEDYKKSMKKQVDFNQPYNKIISDLGKINAEFLKHIQTKDAELFFNSNFNKFSEYIFHEDMGGSPFHDNSFDGILNIKNTKERTSIVRIQESNIKINWKIVNPTAYSKEVSLTIYQVMKYQRNNIYVVFIIKNNSDPHYYEKEAKRFMYFPENKISSVGYQFYLLKPQNLLKGRLVQGKKEMYYYKIGGELLENFGKLFDKDNPQLKIKYFID